MGTLRNGWTKRERFILSVDVGTSSMRCHVYDKHANIRGSCNRKISIQYPKRGWVEMDPEDLWQSFVCVVKGAVQGSGFQMSQMEALGISTQRATFTTWHRKTGKPFHNFIGWQDLRAAEMVKSWNNSCTMKVVHGVMKMLHFLSRQKRFLAASLVVFTPQHVSMRLAWALQNIPQLKQAVDEETCCFGTIDTWLLYKLTKVHNTSHHFGSSDPDIFGVSIPIMSIMADQQAAMFGECCFDAGDVKVTMGTGTFMDINTGNKPHTSVAGLYPLVGWKFGSDVVYLAEGSSADTGTAITWAQKIELFTDVKETSAMASSVSNSDGVCFVPSFSGLQAPLNDPKACAAFMGLKPSTTKSHLVRAILESIAFRNKQLFDVIRREFRLPITKIRADGGVCMNDFVMQLSADLLGQKISRPTQFDMSCLGAAFVAGLGIGFWKSKEELKKLQMTERMFVPRSVKHYTGDDDDDDDDDDVYKSVLQNWEQALQRSMHWYTHTS